LAHRLEGELGFAASLSHFAGVWVRAECIPECDRAFGKGTGSDGEVEQFRGGHLPQLPTR
jgi:hypothetical protein